MKKITNNWFICNYYKEREGTESKLIKQAHKRYCYTTVGKSKQQFIFFPSFKLLNYYAMRQKFLINRTQTFILQRCTLCTDNVKKHDCLYQLNTISQNELISE